MINTLSHILFFGFLESMASIYTLECPLLYNELIFFCLLKYIHFILNYLITYDYIVK